MAKYSEGYEVSQLRHDYVKSIKLFELTYNSTSFYVQMLWMISIGIMLDIEADEFSKLIELIKKDDPNDYLIDFLLSKKVNWDKQAKNFKFPDPYQ
ncbi:PoNe immunity protein domain-containing protein [Chryseobacterium sp. ERMR1:04]|uniref:PoNe immunity protein domain-containing protein n=1 Tax=Chryseobacterium sp. ERMR1:04 TaxID=1705393 RepID=UPI001F51D3C6|nr:PoNe immunity protein domain-containing protein [Chryseobacterium sp. ERMR1:04]